MSPPCMPIPPLGPVPKDTQAGEEEGTVVRKKNRRRVQPIQTAILADLGDFLTGAAGNIAWNVCVFVAGAIFGPTVWNWAKKYMPWNK